MVTPCVGVWIETRQAVQSQKHNPVTPCVGVWIETLIQLASHPDQSHTLRGCVD